MDVPELQQAPSAQKTAVATEPVRFDLAAMFSGRPLYWGESPLEQVQGLDMLMRWCLGLPGARLGISLSSVKSLLESLEASRPEWGHDHEIWHDHLQRLQAWRDHEADTSSYVWLEADDADWWIGATMKSLATYAALFAASIESRDISHLMGRHDCTVFARFDGGALWDHMRTLIEALPPHIQLAALAMMERSGLDRSVVAAMTDVYWSWRLIDFSNVTGSIIWTPLLALWSAWPSSIEWAPPSLADIAPRRQYTADEVASLLENTFWQQLETLFSVVREICRLGIASPFVDRVQIRPPVFYFAAPTEPPVEADEYAGRLRSSIFPLTKACLQSPDPLEEQIAWALVGGDLVTLRRELIGARSYEAHYLLLPTAATSSMSAQIEADVGNLADRLTYQEFSIGHKARDISSRMEPLAVRRAKWDGTLDSVNDVTSEAVDLMPAVGKSHVGRVNERLASLHLVLRRLQAATETGTSDVNQLATTYHSYLDITDDYLRRNLFLSLPRFNHPNLRDAIQNAYPYQYVKQPLEALQFNMEQLSTGMDRISESLKTILDLSDRRMKALSAQLNGLLNVMIAFLALLVGLAQVLGAQPSSTSNPASGPSASLLDRVIQLPQLNTAFRLMFDVVVVALILLAVVYGIIWVIQRLPKRRHKFMQKVQSLWTQVDAANELVVQLRSGAASDDGWRRLDQIDDEAVGILVGLWKEQRAALDEASAEAAVSRATRLTRRGAAKSVHAWIVRARSLEHFIELFDLAPRDIALPRTLCILRFKSTDFFNNTTIASSDFRDSLRVVGYSTPEVNTLVEWLSAPQNTQQIQRWDVATLAQALKAHGVTVIPDQRNPDAWNGGLDGDDPPAKP